MPYYRTLGWLSVELYLTGRQPAQSTPVKAPPSPMSTSSADSDPAKPQRYARWTPLIFIYFLAYTICSRLWLSCSSLRVLPSCQKSMLCVLRRPVHNLKI